nr:hypothetical protein CFP56_00474 [Quercus suber]
MSLDYSVIPHLPPIDFGKLEANTDPNWVMYNIPYRRSTVNMALSQVNFGMPRRPNPDKRFNEHWISRLNPAERWHNNMLGLLFDHGVPPMENYFPDSPHSAEANAAHASTWMTEGPPPPEQHHSWTSPRHYPTANMTIDVKHGLPKEGAKWVFVRLQTKGVVEGRLDMITEIWDVEGRLVAIAQSLSLVVDLRRAMVTKVGRKDGSKM